MGGRILTPGGFVKIKCKLGSTPTRNAQRRVRRNAPPPTRIKASFRFLCEIGVKPENESIRKFATAIAITDEMTGPTMNTTMNAIGASISTFTFKRSESLEITNPEP